MNLRSLQAAFADGVWAGSEPAALSAIVREGGRATASERLAYYAGSVPLRARRRLALAYPVTTRLLGARGLDVAAQAHLDAIEEGGRPRADPIRSWPDFLRKARGFRPDLGDLAALELARSDVAAEEDAPAVGLDALRDGPSGQLGRIVLRFGRAVAVVNASFEVCVLWKAAQRRARPRPRRVRADVLVWRKAQDVFHGALPPSEAVALAAARRGAPLSAVCAAFAKERKPARAAYEALAGWFDEGLIAAVVAPDS